MQREVVECSLEQLAPVIQEILKEENSFTIDVEKFVATLNQEGLLA